MISRRSWRKAVSATELCTDVVIIGGGLAGSALAHALAQTPLSVTLVEARDPSQLQQPSFDDRATALANGSKRILDTLGLWEEVGREATPITSIHISERGRFGAARIIAAEEDVVALGYLLENRILGAALWLSLSRAERFTAVAPAQVRSLEPGPEAVVVRAEKDGHELEIRAKLVVAADGTQSQVREVLGIEALEDDYAQQAVILNCETDIPHRGRAFERFTIDGPIAFLPLAGDRVAAVWTLPQNEAERVMRLDDEAFARELQDAFGHRLGRLTKVGRRSAYPLMRLRSESLVAERTVLIGSAAVNLHPVAGQGFNLALRDVAALAEVLSDALIAAGSDADPGAGASLERYQDWRIRDQERVAAFTHGLIRFFGQASAPLEISRGLGLMLFDLIPGAKAGLARHTMGLSGRLSRLARGLPLLPGRGSSSGR
ncbi:MAG: 2-octaprenyl-6-methoxyphenyl hydroxylase [Gammaproteobacteria bacterium]|nr:2-octaprenyl-6-methoxyphenyl hydroxylase [Gammaproteobacteria bacterium]